MEHLDFKIEDLTLPRWKELPNIDLYMDQILTYLDEILSKIIKNEKNNGADHVIHAVNDNSGKFDLGCSGRYSRYDSWLG